MVRENELDISEILRGMVPGRLQSVGCMQVLPLIGDPNLFDEEIVSPGDKEQKSTLMTRNYGEMTFKNATDKVLLVPCHVGYITKQRAQDHAMSRCGMVPKQKTKVFGDAMCIEQSQGGYIAEDQHRMMILPYTLREKALKKRSEKSFNKLWDDIAEFNRSMGVSARAHLVDFLTHYEKQLDEFVAEFECVPQQTGAIILVGGHVVGFERAPNPRFWLDVWPALIRECYGSLAIKVAKEKKLSKNRITLGSGYTTLEELEAGLTEAREKEEKATADIVRNLLDKPFSCKVEEGLLKYSIFTIENDQFSGQVVREGEKVCYASLFTKSKWAENAPWRESKKFAV